MMFRMKKTRQKNTNWLFYVVNLMLSLNLLISAIGICGQQHSHKSLINDSISHNSASVESLCCHVHDEQKSCDDDSDHSQSNIHSHGQQIIMAFYETDSIEFVLNFESYFETSVISLVSFFVVPKNRPPIYTS